MPYTAHLLVVCHGLWGTTSHIGYICRSAIHHATNTTLPRSRPRSSSIGKRDDPEKEIKLVVLAAKLNEWTNTYDGIDICAERVVKEIDEEIERIAADGGQVERFSIVGYSLGGLVARYVLGLLESRSPSFFQRIRPVNFTTFASPAIGIPRYHSFWSSVIGYLGARLLSRSGSQLYGNDRFLPSSLVDGNNQKDSAAKKKSKNWFAGREKAEPLLNVLADPQYSFFKALAAFERVEIYANTVNDRTVPFPTGAIEAHDPFALARAKAQKLMQERGDEPDGEIDITQGGLQITLDPDCAVITDYKQIDPPKIEGEGALKPKRRFKIRLPLLLRPTTYPFSRPVSVAVIVLLPLALPLALCYLVGRFMIQSRQSRLRINDIRKTTGGGREGMLQRVGVSMREVAETVGGPNNPEYAAGMEAGEYRDENSEEEIPVTRKGLQTLRSYSGIDTPPLARPISPPTSLAGDLPSTTADDPTASHKIPTDPVLTAAQLEMIKNLNSIKQMRKHFVYLPQSRNSHGAIVARDLSYQQHRPGTKVVDRWASELRL